MNDRLPIIPQHSADPRDALDALERQLNAPEEVADAPPSLPPTSAAEEQLAAADAALGALLYDLDHAPRVDMSAVVQPRRPRIGPAIVQGQRWLRRLTGWDLAPLAEQVRAWQESAQAAIRAVADAQRAQHAAWEERFRVHFGQQAEAFAAHRAETDTRLATLESAVQVAQGIQSDLLNEYRLLGRLDRLERLVQVLRLAGRDLPAEPALGTRDLLARDEAGRPATSLAERLGRPEKAADPCLVDVFRDAPGPVLDLACAGGATLRALQDAGIDAYGIDESPEQVAACRAAGLSAFRDSILVHLGGLADASLGGLIADHVLEHLGSGDLWEAIRLAGDKVRPGGRVVIQSPNPRALATGAADFWRDPTRRRPLHPDALRILLEGAGFGDLALEDRDPYPPDERLPVPAGDPALAAPIERLNDLLFGARTFRLTARRAATPLTS